MSYRLYLVYGILCSSLLVLSRKKQCHEGTYLDGEECKSCTEGKTYMDVDNHTYTRCKICTAPDPEKHIIEQFPCTMTRNTVLKCTKGYTKKTIAGQENHIQCLQEEPTQSSPTDQTKPDTTNKEDCDCCVCTTPDKPLSCTDQTIITPPVKIVYQSCTSFKVGICISVFFNAIIFPFAVFYWIRKIRIRNEVDPNIPWYKRLTA